MYKESTAAAESICVMQAYRYEAHADEERACP